MKPFIIANWKCNSTTKKNGRGFTVIELLIALAIIGLLAAIVLVAIKGTKGKAKIAGILQYSASVHHALGAYIMGEWKFEDNCDDTSGNGHNGTCPAVTFVDNEISELGRTAEFDAAGDKINTMSEFIGTQSITACAWIYPTGWGENTSGRIIDNAKYRFYVNQLDAQLRYTSNALTVAKSATNSIVLNTWIFVCVTRTAAGVANLYINGVLSGVANQDSGTPSAVATTNVIIGNRNTGDRTFDGKIDEVRIYSEVLSSSQIQKLYAEGAEKHGLLVRE